MKKLLILLFVLLIVPAVFADIIVVSESMQQKTQDLPNPNLVSSNSRKHEFYVNKYYFYQKRPHPEKKAFKEILVQPINTSSNIKECGNASLSFKLTNPGDSPIIYYFSLRDFEGTSYIAPSLLIPGKESRIIDYILKPECHITGEINPKVVIETKTETALVPNIINIEPVMQQNESKEIINKTQCRYYFNDSICMSKFYFRLYSGEPYKIDLSKYFYDPDGDFLEYGAEPGINLKIKIKNSIATIRPRFDFIGPEQAVFYAKDNKGGIAESRKFYFQVLPNKRTRIENFIRQNLFTILILMVIVLALLIAALTILKKKEKS